MSSPDDSERAPEPNERDSHPVEKKKRIRACDVCRRRKVRCKAEFPARPYMFICGHGYSNSSEALVASRPAGDGGRVAGGQCTNCLAYNCPCTYTESDKKRFADPAYVQNLEKQLAQTHELLATLTAKLGATERSGSGSPLPRMNEGRKSHIAIPLPFQSASKAFLDSEDVESSEDESGPNNSLDSAFKKLDLAGCVPPRFVGKSSNLTLIRTALDVKQENSLTVQDLLFPRHAEPWLEGQYISIDDPHPPGSFPEPALMNSLIDLYFSYCNIFHPLLHRPTFEKSIYEGLHLTDVGFGSTVLLVCAIGAKLTDDPRVLVDPRYPSSAGWSYFIQMQSTRKAIKMSRPTIYDLQVPCLVTIFLLGAPCPQICAAVVAHGIRVALDLGAHRRKCYKDFSTAEGELLKRAFWILISIDCGYCSGLGLPCCIQEEDYDLDFPVDCDDEFWYTEDPNAAFKQPSGKPSKLSFFISCLKLNQIHARTLRTIYAINKSKAILGLVGPDWEQQMVAELDSALNQWIDTVPAHLRWNPRMEDLDFLSQSAFLYSTYYELQIIIHRQYIPSPKKTLSLSFPSLAICTNAARSLVHIVEVHHERSAISSYQYMLHLFFAGLVLIINIWGGKQSGMSSNPAKEMQDVHKCMRILKSLQSRWYLAGRILDVLTQLATVSDLPLSTQSPQPKQSHDVNMPGLSTTTESSGATIAVDPRLTAGFGRVQQPVLANSNWLSNDAGLQTAAFTLPVHSDELARLPLHPVFDAGGSAWKSAWSQRMDTLPDYGLHAVNGQSYASPESLDSHILPSFSTSSSTPFTAGTPEHGLPEGWFGDLTPSQGSTLDSISALSNQALELLSTAPNGMDWSNWGTYINNFSGFGESNGGSDNHPIPGL